MKQNIMNVMLGFGAVISAALSVSAADSISELKPLSKCPVAKVSAATNTIITERPEGIHLDDLEWSSTACAAVNGAASWVESYGFSPTVIVDGSKMYIYAPLTQLSEIGTAWIEGEIDESAGKVVFPTPQAYLLNSTQTGGTMMLYATRINAQTGKIEEGNTDLVFDITEEGYFQSDGGLLALTDLNGGFYGFGDKDIVMSYVNDEKATPPSGLEAEDYILNYTRYGEKYRQSAKVIYDGDDVYFSDPLGIEDVWFKGRREGDKVVVAPGQYLGTGTGFPMYLTTAREFTRYETDPLGNPTAVTDYEVTPDVDLVFTFDESSKTMSSDQIMLVNSGKSQRGMAYAALKSPSYVSWTAVPLTPKTPVVDLYIDLKEYEMYGIRGCMVGFDIYAESGDGDFIPQEDMYYQVCFDGSPLEFFGGSLLPFYLQFSDAASESSISMQESRHQLQYPVAPKHGLSVQSFYYYDGQLIPSEIASYVIEDGQLREDSGVDEAVCGDIPAAVWHYDLNGVASRKDKGVHIRLTKDSRGNVTGEKVCY